jgi:hypothetical protein
VWANPFTREVLIDTGDRYEKGFVWFDPRPRFRPAGYGITTNLADPAAQAAAATPRGRQYLGWSRFPFFVVERGGDRTYVHVNDARYSGDGHDGWARETFELEP